MKDSQYYSKIAKKYLEDLSIEEECPHHFVSYNNIDIMEDLFDLFGGDRDKLIGKSTSAQNFIYHKFSFVMNKLDRESKRPDALFEKHYVNYPGVINCKTRCFVLKEKYK